MFDRSPTVAFAVSLSQKYTYYWVLTIVDMPELSRDISTLILITDLINSYALLPENFPNCPTSILSNILVTLRKSHEIVFVEYF